MPQPNPRYHHTPPVVEPVIEPAAEPVIEPASDPVIDPAAEPAAEPEPPYTIPGWDCVTARHSYRIF